MGMDRPPTPFTLGPTEGQYFTQWRIDNLIDLLERIIYNFGSEPLVELQDIVIDYDAVNDYHRLMFTAGGKRFIVRHYKVYSVDVDGADLTTGCPQHYLGEFTLTIRNKVREVQANAEIPV